jgi:hypothetical protein
VKRLVWPGVVALLVLIARWLAYALAAPNPLATRFQGAAGGPGLVVVTLVSLGLAAAVSVFVVWMAAVGVRERQWLHPERVPPDLRPARLALRAGLLFVASSLAFATFESYLHWRAGIGFHGLSCLVGPVHRNALPLLAALSLASAALAEAAQHVLEWVRSMLRLLAGARLVLGGAGDVSSFESLLLARAAWRPGRPRAPPTRA